MVPFKLASQPGAAIVNCHGSLSVMLGGAVSFGYSSNVPALREEMNADAAPANKKNRSFMCRVLSNDVLIGKITLQRSSAIFRYIPKTRLLDFGTIPSTVPPFPGEAKSGRQVAVS